MDSPETAEACSIPVLRRDASVFARLPLEYRWEFTRRHPYYLLNWHRRRAEADGVPRSPAAFLQTKVLYEALGLTMDVDSAPDPSSDFDRINEGDNTANGIHGVQRITIREAVRWLLLLLPEIEATAISHVLEMATDPSHSFPQDDANKSLQRYSAVRQLDAVPSSTLDCYVPGCIFSVHPYLSDRVLQQGLKSEVNRYRRDSGICTDDVRPNKLSAYLNALDAVEGWNQGAYELDRQCTIKEAARQLKVSHSTLWSRYSSAFKWLTGYEYTFETWWVAYGMYHNALARVENSDSPMYLTKRKAHKRVAKPVDETTVFSESNTRGAGLDSLKSDQLFEDARDLRIDINEMLEKGCTQEEIARRLKLSPGIVGRFIEFCKDSMCEHGESS